MTEVLVADVAKDDRERAAAALRLGGYRVRTTRSVVHAAGLLRDRRLAAVVVDPSAEEPAAVVAELRSRTDVPIIVVSARDHEWDKVAVLDAGADDYLTKPFGVEELAARLRAVFRRMPRPVEKNQAVVTPDFTVHVRDRLLVKGDGSEERLTPVEWHLFEILLEQAGHLVPQRELLLGVWGPGGLDKPGNVRVTLAHLRAKVEPRPATPRYFLTARGLGVRFDPTGGRR